MSLDSSIQVLGSSQSSAREVLRAVEVVSNAISSGDLPVATFIEKLQGDLSAADQSTRASALGSIADVITELQEQAAVISDSDWRLFSEPAIQALLKQDLPVFGSALRVLMPAAAVPDLRKAVFGVRRADEVITLQYDVLNIAIARGTNLSLELRLQAVVALWALVVTQMPVPHDAAALAMLLTQLFTKQRDAGLLMNSFTTLATLMTISDAEELRPIAPKLFASFADYYPVLAVPYGAPVSMEDLNKSLRNCFSASSALAEHALPFLLDKAESTVTATRVEAFNALAACVRAYGKKIPNINDFLVLASDCIKNNGCFGNSEALKSACFELVSAVNDTLEEAQAESFLKSVVDNLLSTLIPTKDNLDGDTPYDTEVCVAARALLAKTFASIPRARKHLERCASRIGEVAAQVPDAAASVLAGALADFVTALVPVAEDAVRDKEKSAEIKPCIDVLKEKISSLLDVMKGSTVVGEVGRGCAALAGVDGAFVPDAEVAKLVGRMLAFAGDKEKCSKDARSAVFLAMSLAAQRRESVVLDALKHTDFSTIDSATLEGYCVVARASTQVFQMLFGGLSEVVVSKLGSTDPNLQHLFDSWSRCVEYAKSDTLTGCMELAVSVVKKLLSLPRVGLSSKSISAMKSVVQNITEQATDDAQEDLFKSLVTLPWTPLIGLAVASFREHASTVAVQHEGFVSSLIQLRRGSKAPATGVVIGDDERMTIAVELASLFNKCSLGVDATRKCLEDTAADVRAHKKDDPMLLCWLARSLMMRVENPLATQLVEDAVEASIAGDEAAGRGFEILAPETDPIDFGLVKRAGRVMIGSSYGKSVFDIAFEHLFTTFKSNLSNKGAIRALTAVLGAAPLSVISSVTQQVTPFALASLNSVDACKDDVSPILGLIRFAVSNDTSFFRVDHDRLNRLILRLCALANWNNCSNGHSREAALSLLVVIHKVFSTPELLPAMQIVRSSLQTALDDPKRPVRCAAVRCNNAWHITNQTHMEEDYY